MGANGGLNAVVGILFICVWGSVFHVTIIDAALAFAFFVLVPLLIGEVCHDADVNRAEQWLQNVNVCSLPFAGAGTISLTLLPGQEAFWWALLWFIYTLLIAIGGAMRLLGRGWKPVEEAVIDVGLMYISIGGLWLLLYQSEAALWLPYSDVIVQLTAVHFHYAAFVIPLVVGFYGRWRAEMNRDSTAMTEQPFTYLGVGIIIGPFLVALGLHQGQPVEMVAVGVYTCLVVWLCTWWIWNSVYFRGWAQWGLQLSSGLLLLTIGLAAVYGMGLMTESHWLSISEMLRWHGAVNAFGFSFLSVLIWRNVHPIKRHVFTAFPVSQLRGSGYIGNHIIYKQKWDAQHQVRHGLVDDWGVFQSEYFSPDALHRDIRDFYMYTTRYHMTADIQWEKPFHMLHPLIAKMTTKMGQVNLPADKMAMEGDITPINDHKDGRGNVRAWLRKNKATGDPIFTALYATHHHAGETYMNIALPFPLGVMTGVLRPINQKGGNLVLSSYKRKKANGDEGIYFTLGDWTFRLLLNESFHVELEDEGRLTARQTMTFFGLPLVKIDYHLVHKD
ncbi:YndJ family protein [Thalassobacillus sp. CUG 92003]|uniref:YndJ family protein n=1 Tax=Thalassobacillus sp. CUG 92003 TaxID=2736641 RepID=UPI0015E75847|nr:YndJ family protein [Thalassobacillus sp. CUG 92003]